MQVKPQHLLHNFSHLRPQVDERLFRSDSVEDAIETVASAIADTDIMQMFYNCFPNTLDATVHFTEHDENGLPDTFIVTGDYPGYVAWGFHQSSLAPCRRALLAARDYHIGDNINRRKRKLELFKNPQKNPCRYLRHARKHQRRQPPQIHQTLVRLGQFDVWRADTKAV